MEVLLLYSLLLLLLSESFSTPTVSNPYPNIDVSLVDQIFSYKIPYDTFTPVADPTNSIHMSFLGPPSWLTFLFELPDTIGSYSYSASARDIIVKNDYAYIADLSSGLVIIDVSDVTFPFLTGTYSLPSSFQLFIDDTTRRAYVAAQSSGLRIIDVSNPYSPSLLGSYTGQSRTKDVFVVGNIAYIVGSDFQVLDVTYPSSPSLLGYIDVTTEEMHGIYLKEQYAYIASSQDGLYIFNIENPFSPTKIGQYDPSTSTSYYCYTVFVKDDEDVAFISVGMTGFEAVDVSNKAYPYRISGLDSTDYGFAVEYENDFVFISDRNDGITFVDVTSLSNPVELFVEGSVHAYNSDVISNHVFVADGSGGLKIMRYGDLEIQFNPVEVFPNGILCGSISKTLVLLGWDESGTSQDPFDIIFHTSQTCSSHGTCQPKDEDDNQCVCFGPYSGDLCLDPTCFGVGIEYPTLQCSGHGTCVGIDTCQCEENYYGVNCNITSCNDIFSNDSSVCHSHGSCSVYNGPCGCDWSEPTGYYFGNDCEFTFCDWNPSTIPDLVCTGGKGLCWPMDVCQCYDDYYGIKCNVTTCGPYFSNSSESRDVYCGGNGRCWPHDSCLCDPKYYGEGCEVTECDGILSNSSDLSYCSGHGSCGPVAEECHCSEDYYGDVCRITTCQGVMGNHSTEICSGGHGFCWPKDVCNCFDSYYSETSPSGGSSTDNCDITKCFGVYSNETSEVCSSHGVCWPLDTCSCEEGYYGVECEVTTCGGIFSNQTEIVCHSKGTCWPLDYCTCDRNIFGAECNVSECDGVLSNDSTVCTSHGECKLSGTCVCSEPEIYFGDFCENWDCYGYRNDDEENVCSEHGTCLDYDQCNCSTGIYSGDSCEYWSCFGIPTDEVDDVCNAHGDCVDQDFCKCNSGYSLKECTMWECGEYLKNTTSELICNGRGTCVESQMCDCGSTGYTGNLCETWTCGFDKDSELACNGNGVCVLPDTCECNKGYSGKFCDKNEVFTSVVLPSIGAGGVAFILMNLCCFLCIGVCVFCCVLCAFISLILCCCCGMGTASGAARVGKGNKKQYQAFRKLNDDNFDLLLRESLIDQEAVDIAHLNINKEMFNIQMKDIRILNLLGEGGSRSVVYRAEWNRTIVAFKCFKVRHLCGSQSDFDEFEKEVSLFASISHPHIVRFFGCSLKPPRVGIVMEFCENGEIIQFYYLHRINLMKQQQREKLRNKKVLQRYPIEEKVRMILEIINSMIYLHERNIIHRDLKCENILVDEHEKCRLTDFGLSRVFEKVSQTKTSKIGTAVYMAPELIKDNYYGSKCDVYSFAMVVLVMITENSSPYGSDAMNVQFKVAMDPTYRPSVSQFKRILKNHDHYIFDDVDVDDDDGKNYRNTGDRVIMNYLRQKQKEEEEQQKEQQQQQSPPKTSEFYNEMTRSNEKSILFSEEQKQQSHDEVDDLAARRKFIHEEDELEIGERDGRKDYSWILDIVQASWGDEPDKRPSFLQIQEMFEKRRFERFDDV